MTAVDAPTVLDEVRRRIARLAAPTSQHPVQEAASRAVVGGKLLRPRLVLIAAGPDAHVPSVISAAAAIEVLHAALLVHDDIIDSDDERRGEPSVVRAATADAAATGLSRRAAERLGLTTAIVAGDALLVRSLAEIARIDAPAAVRGCLIDIVERAMVRAAEGEHDDVLLSGRPADEAAIEGILERKTADYSFRAPLELGAVLGGRDEAAIEALSAIGLRMGIVYQLRDDVLGIFGDEADTGKSTLSDIRAGSPTLLSALASRDAAWGSVAQHYGDPGADEGAASRVRAAMRASGALDAVERRIADGAAQVREMLVAAPVEARVRTELEAILVRCAERRR